MQEQSYCQERIWNIPGEIWSITEKPPTWQTSLFIALHGAGVTEQLRGQRRRKEMLTEAGYYSWQEKIMNGHSLFLLFFPLRLFLPHMSNICGWKKLSEQRRFSNGRGKTRILWLCSPKHLHLMLSIRTVPTEPHVSHAWCMLDTVDLSYIHTHT